MLSDKFWHWRKQDNIIGSFIPNVLGKHLHIAKYETAIRTIYATSEWLEKSWRAAEYYEWFVFFGIVSLGNPDANNIGCGGDYCTKGCNRSYYHQKLIVQSGFIPSFMQSLGLCILGLLGVGFCMFTFILRLSFSHRGALLSLRGKR